MSLQVQFDTKEKVDGIGRTMNHVVNILEKLTDKFDNLNTRVKAIELVVNHDHSKLFQELLEAQEHTREWVETVRARAQDHKEQILKAVADVRTDGEVISNNQKILSKEIKKRKRKDDDVSPYQWNQEYKEQCIWMLDSVEDHYPDVYKKVQESFEKRQSKKRNLSVHNDVYDLTESNEGLPKRAFAYVENVPNKEPED